MCLAVPGKIISISDENPIFRTGKVSFNGAIKEVNMAYVPEAKVNDYVIVHAGFALSILNEEQAKQNLEYWQDIQNFQQSESSHFASIHNS
jgi:hydrogenase expression/formation protein HypC